jgi:hypothetical protein
MEEVVHIVDTEEVGVYMMAMNNSCNSGVDCIGLKMAIFLMTNCI